MMNLSLTDWQLDKFAPILTLDEASKLISDWRKGEPKPHIILTSGGFDPVHPGHLSCLKRSKDFVEEFHLDHHGFCHKTLLIVAVNSNGFLVNKKGVPLMSHKTRCQVIAAIHEVDVVIAFNPSDKSDSTVCEVIEKISPNYFTKGGDRSKGNVPEEVWCEMERTKILYGVGEDKAWSSSDILSLYRENNARFNYGFDIEGFDT